MKNIAKLNIAMRVTAASVVLCFSAACATSSKNIGASYISPMQYSTYSCDQLRQEYLRISHRVVEVAGKQDSAASRDAVAMGVGLVLFWPALFLLAGNKGSPEELARLKGESEAIEVSSIEKNCLLSQEIAEQKKKQQEIAKQELENRDKEVPINSPYGGLR